jgi:hypothetical protein
MTNSSSSKKSDSSATQSMTDGCFEEILTSYTRQVIKAMTVNRRLINSFRALLDDIEVKELHLDGQRFMWSCGTQNPTHTKIDHVFTTKEWEILHPH